jgi:hypothetical protein
MVLYRLSWLELCRDSWLRENQWLLANSVKALLSTVELSRDSWLRENQRLLASSVQAFLARTVQRFLAKRKPVAPG